MSGNYFVGFTYDRNNRKTLDEWRKTYGFDRNSLVGDPLFVDPANRNYSLRPGSPALLLGFVNIDQARIGLLPDFPFDRD
ncbi:MAG: hypothetical protein HYX87_03960 [Chloroflexi bacterium]|nr:hypothetical protein [Chloroflexota bacterium]